MVAFIEGIVVVNTVLYVFLLLFSVFYLPMEAFWKRRLTELFSQGFHLFFSSMFLSVLVLGTGLLLGFMTIRFGVTGLIFIPVTAVLELNLLYYIYGKHGKMERLPRPERSFMEILRPFGGKDDE